MSEPRECEWCWEKKASTRERRLRRKHVDTGLPVEEKWIICDECVDQV